MASPNLPKTDEDPLTLLTESGPRNSRDQFGWKSVFFGPHGLRAGWRLLIFIVLVGVQGVLISFFGPFLGRLLPFLGAPSDLPKGSVSPAILGSGDAMLVLALCIATWIMSRIEHRRFGEYGLPLRAAFKKDFWLGSFLGFGAISGTLLTMFLLHDFRVAGLAIQGRTIVYCLLAWLVTFLLVGMFEEFGFRGYIQHTLSSGIGFWPAALVISGLFGLVHFFADPSENAVGSIAVVMFGLLLCLFLRRTGNLWCSVGFHLAYDWGQTFFYGVPDSGVVPYHNLLNSTRSGPLWLTGGAVGPEASVLTPLALVVVALVFSRFCREKRYEIA